MTLITKSIDELDEITAPGADALLVLRDPSTGKDFKVKKSNLVSGASSTYEWNPETSYDTDQIVSWAGTWWKSLIDSNFGNVPAEDTNWTEVSAAEESSLKEFEAGKVYKGDFVVVVHLDNFYRLTNITRPYSAASFIGADWQQFGSMQDLTPYFKIDGSRAMEGDIDMNNNWIKQLKDATSNDEAVNLGQLNAAIDGLKPKGDCVAATTADNSLFDIQTIDGVSVMAGQRVLVKAQTDQTQNGIYDVVAGGDWVRSSDSDTGLELQGAFTLVTGGTVNANTSWTQYSIGITIGVTNILWRQVGSATPDATSSTKGKAKLYNSLGSATDGAVDQNTVTRKMQDAASISGTASGTNTYTVALSPALDAYRTGQTFEILFTNANTGAATLNINSLGAKSIKKNVSTALVTGDIAAGQILSLSYDGTNFQIIGGSIAQASPTQAGVAKLFTDFGAGTDGAIDQNTATRKAQDSSAITGTAGGTDTYTLSLTPALDAYRSGQTFEVIFTNANTGAATLNVNSLGAKAIKKNGSAALIAGDIAAEQVISLTYDGTNFQIIGGGMAAFAPLASPALTGNPTAPTQAAGDRSTKIANTLWVGTEITNNAIVANAAAKLYLFNAY